MDWTDVYYRQLARMISRHTWLYTEMVVDQTLLHSPFTDKFLWFPPEQRPIVCQLGGSDPALLARFVVNNQLPKSVLVVKVQYCFFQCAKALMRSRLWDPAAQIERTALPSNGKILEDITKGEFDGAAYDQIAPQRLKDTMY